MATDPTAGQICGVQNTENNCESEMQETYSDFYCFTAVHISLTDNAWQIEIQIKEHTE